MNRHDVEPLRRANVIDGPHSRKFGRGDVPVAALRSPRRARCLLDCAPDFTELVHAKNVG